MSGRSRKITNPDKFFENMDTIDQLNKLFNENKKKVGCLLKLSKDDLDLLACFLMSKNYIEVNPNFEVVVPRETWERLQDSGEHHRKTEVF